MVFWLKASLMFYSCVMEDMGTTHSNCPHTHTHQQHHHPTHAWGAWGALGTPPIFQVGRRNQSSRSTRLPGFPFGPVSHTHQCSPWNSNLSPRLVGLRSPEMCLGGRYRASCGRTRRGLRRWIHSQPRDSCPGFMNFSRFLGLDHFRRGLLVETSIGNHLQGDWGTCKS